MVIYARGTGDKYMKTTVLYVDDERQSLRAMSAMFHKHPYRLITAQSASEALRLLANENVDIVISDERMPGMSGSELLTVVRNRYPETIRMMLTGYASPPAAVRAVNDAAVHRFFAKPCPHQKLLTAINETLAERESTETSIEEESTETSARR